MHDELRRLDEDLAAGRLDADSYRSRRDELLATAREPEPAAPAARNGHAAPNGLTASTGHTSRDDGRPGSPSEAPPGSGPPDPFPPPFRWCADDRGTDDGGTDDAEPDDTPDGGAPLPDATQVVAASRADRVDTGPERTQVVRHGVAGVPGDPTRVVDGSAVRAADPWLAPGRVPAARSRPRTPPAPPAPPERTQFVPGAAVARTAGGRSVPARQTRPPWVGERSTSPPGGPMQGREVFARGGPGVATVVGTAAVVLVVLAVLVLSFVLR